MMAHYRSETAKCRERLLPYCQGQGADLGCGTVEKIRPEAIGVDLTPGLAEHVGPIETLPFADQSLDYVYSSHALEHCMKPQQVLQEWLRVLKPGGRLVLYLPHREWYQQWNPEHFFNPDPVIVAWWVQEAALAVGRPLEIVHTFMDHGDDRYSFDLVAQMAGEPLPVVGPPKTVKVVIYPTGSDGCAHVRALWPGEAMQRSGLAEVHFGTAGDTRLLEWGEVFLFQRTRGGRADMAWWDKVGRTGKRRLYDTDDDIFVHPHVFGNPYYSEEELIGMRRMISEAHLTICSTPGVEAAMRQYTPRTVVIPNGAHPPLFAFQPSRFPGQVRLGFIAAPAHDADFALAAPGINAVLRKYPEVRLVMMGHIPAGAQQKVPWNKVFERPWVDYTDVHQAMMQTGIQIILVPWAECPFNRGKSMGKWIDAVFMQAAVIATPMSDFATLRHRENAILVPHAEGWQAAIEELVCDVPLRESIVATARKDCLEKFSYTVLAPRWVQACISNQ